MSKYLARKSVFAAFLCAFLSVTVFAADIKEVVKNAKASYYTLQGQGLRTFKCTVTPNWQKFLEDVEHKPLAPDNPKLKLLKPVRFSVSIDEQGQSKITPFTTTGEKIDPSLDQMISGFQDMLSGFYQTWTSMVLSGPFSESESGLTLQQEGDNYRILGKDGGSDVEIKLTRDYLITEMKATIEGSIIDMFPKFAKTDKGLLMTSIDSDINHGQQRVAFEIKYQEIQGISLPGQVSIRVTLPTQVIAVEITFGNYEVSKR
jgi:hypothetical protein